MTEEKTAWAEIKQRIQEKDAAAAAAKEPEGPAWPFWIGGLCFLFGILGLAGSTLGLLMGEPFWGGSAFGTMVVLLFGAMLLVYGILCWIYEELKAQRLAGGKTTP